jgi:DNA-binding NarL/FixJ family response regulator
MEQNLTQLKFLILDDSYLHRGFISEALEELTGTKNIIKVSTKSEAEEEYKNNADISLMIVDLSINERLRGVSMEDKMGIAFLEKVRKENENVRLIAYTSYTLDQDSIERLKRIDAHYVKKYSFATAEQSLITKIAELLQLS